MKTMRTTVFINILSLMIAFLMSAAGTSSAFHEGGVGHCDGCHSMHNSADNPVTGTPNSTLLKGSDASSTCLNCHNHQGPAIGQDWIHHVRSDDGNILSSGGDFHWMETTYTFDEDGVPATSSGEAHGHNVISLDYGLVQDSNPSNQTSPGSSGSNVYQASDLGCASCHDPHGQVLGGTGAGQGAVAESGSYGCDQSALGPNEICGNYRILGDSAFVTGDGFNFSQNAPTATADSFSGRSVAYGSGMSEWCGNCHNEFQADSTATAKHPAGDLVHLNGATGIATNYNSYVSSGDFTGTANYDGLVPIELGVTDGSLLCATDPFASAGSSGSADSNSNVMCLTCHRAHASAHDNAGRWDFRATLLAESHALVSNSLTANEKLGAYYRDGVTVDIATGYGLMQKSLCNKCHVQD